MFELRESLQRILSEKKSPLTAHFSDKVWVAKLAYLCDIFSLLNLPYCGKMTTVFNMADKVVALKAVQLWGERVNRSIMDMFQKLTYILDDTESLFSQKAYDQMFLLLKEFQQYFPTTKDP